MTDQDMTGIFLDVYSHELPRQGPGSDASTRTALSACEHLPEKPHILDVGCGSGMQTITLAKATGGTIIAVDYFQQYLDALVQRATDQGIAEQITAQQGDMSALDFESRSFDLIWSEGAAYIMGIEEALSQWKAFLKPQAYLAFSHVAWIKENPPQEIVDYWQNEYPAIGDIAATLKVIKDNGYDVIDHFTLPFSDWWDHYYHPLEARLAPMSEKYKDNEVAEAVFEMTRTELAMHRNYGEWYSYEFYVCRLQ